MLKRYRVTMLQGLTFSYGLAQRQASKLLCGTTETYLAIMLLGVRPATESETRPCAVGMSQPQLALRAMGSHVISSRHEYWRTGTSKVTCSSQATA